MLATANLRFQYNNSKTFNFQDLEIGDGEHLLLVGPSGIGKTTLLHLLGGLLKPLSGGIKIAETDITQLSTIQLDHFRGQHLGFVFQKSHFVNSLSVLENLLLIQSLASRKVDRTVAFDLLKKLDIADQASMKVMKLSQGQQQRASIAMALINRPAVVLADEPTSSLDDSNCTKVMQLLRDQCDINDSHLVVITHDQRVISGFEKVVSL
ncbi:MAG: ATP-binding cassette domain-containing protein [Cyclobacteriaceae bacterium]|nr:ATP-binding cassette domain-containing protein [Cyclobacteriaceae bacterium HetDA_MAG_MS6]